MSENAIDVRLRGVHPRSYWGCNSIVKSNSNIITYRDNEIIYAVGSRLVILDYIEQQSRIIPVTHFEVQTVLSFTASADSKYLAVTVKLSSSQATEKKSQLLCIDLDSLTSIPKRPTLIEHSAENSDYDDHYFVSIAFSACCTFIACASSAPDVGLLLYDRASGHLLQQVKTTNTIFTVTFNPVDSSRVCTTGKHNLFLFWRCSERVLHPIPVSGLKKGHHTFTCHAWLSENKVVAGTDTGSLVLVTGGESHPHRFTPAFGSPSQVGHLECPVSAILIRNDIIIATTAANHIAIFEARRAPPVPGGSGATYVLIKLARIRVTNLSQLTGIQWSICSSTSNYEVVLSSTTVLTTMDLKAGEYKMAAVDGGLAGSTAASGAGRTTRSTHSGSVGSHSSGSQSEFGPVEWIDQRAEKPILTFHSSSIHSMAMAIRTSTVITAGDDDTIRVWDYSLPNQPGLLIDNFSDRKNVVPNSIAVHPSGFFVTFGCEDDVREFCVTDSKFELVRKLSTKTPFTGPNDTPFVNTQPVSLVRYSNGGHLLAAVTGRMAQLFHMYNLDFSSGDIAGLPTRVMAITDHKSTISDLVFSYDDKYIYTCAMDGSVYSWETFSSARNGEYIDKGTPALKLAVSAGLCGSPKYIVASFVAEQQQKYSTSAVRKAMIGTKRKPSGAVGKGHGVGRETSIVAGGLLGRGESSMLRSESNMVGTAASASSEEDPQHSTNSKWSNSKKNFLCVWKNTVSLAADILYLDTPATSVTFGRLDGHWTDRTDFLVIGLADGRILLSTLPLPTKVLNLASTLPSSANLLLSSNTIIGRSSRGRNVLAESGGNKSLGILPATIVESDYDEDALTTKDGSAVLGSTGPASVAGGPVDGGGSNSNLLNSNGPSLCLDIHACAKLQLHSSEVTEVVVSSSGFWIFSSSSDGTIFMTSTSIRAKEFSDIPESTALENGLFVTEKVQLQMLRARMEEVDSIIEETRRDCDRTVHKLTDQKNQAVADLESQMKREVQKRDDIILRGREEQARQVRKLNEEMQAIQKKLTEDIVELEYAYERKLSQESLYLEKMRQAFDEVVVHSRLDMIDAQKQLAQFDARLLEQRSVILGEAEKQKALVLAYVDFVKQRYGEVINSLEEGQEEERTKLKSDLHSTKLSVEDVKKQSREEIVYLQRQIHELHKTISVNEEEALKLKSDLEWANTRIHKLEHALNQATSVVKRHQDASEQLEFKVGDYQEQIRDMEKIRRSLTSQLHLLRQELGPKEERLLQASERLQEVGREYELAIYAISEKEQSLARKGESLHLLQKQLGELRNTCHQKDTTIRRAAKLFEEYKYQLQQASLDKNFFIKAVPPLHGGLQSALSTALAAGVAAGEAALIGGEAALGGAGIGPNSAVSNSVSAAAGHLHQLLHSAPQKKSKKEVTTKYMDKFSPPVDSVETTLKRLDDIFHPYVVSLSSTDTSVKDDAQIDFEERERQVSQLHKNIAGLKANLEHSNQIATGKVKNHVTDNMILLKEVNDLRHEVRALSLENQRLAASIRFTETKRKDRRESPTQYGGGGAAGSQRPMSPISVDAAQAPPPRTRTPSSNRPASGTKAAAGGGGGKKSPQGESSASASGFPRINPHLRQSPSMSSLDSEDFTDYSVLLDQLSSTADAANKVGSTHRSSSADNKIAELFEENKKLLEQQNQTPLHSFLEQAKISQSQPQLSQFQSGKKDKEKRTKIDQKKVGHATIILPDVSTQRARR